MCDIKKDVLKCFMIVIFVIMGGGDGIVYVLGCARKGKGSNLILDMSWSWHHHDDLLWIQLSINMEPKKKKKTWWWWFVMGSMNY